KSVAYNWRCPLFDASAMPLKTAPSTVAPSSECVPSAVGFQPLIVPLSAAKMNRAEPLLPVGPVRLKPPPPLKTTPVGAPLMMLTTSPCLTPLPLYSVDLSVPLSDTHHGPVGGAAMPQPFCRSVSAGFDPSAIVFDVRLCTVNVPGTSLRATAAPRA